MSFRVTLAAALVLIMLAAFAVIVPSSVFLQQQLHTLFPEDLVQATSGALYTLLAEQAIITIGVVGILLLVLYGLLSVLVVRPLRAVVVAMEAFVEGRESLALPTPPPVPSEIRKLMQLYNSMVDRVMSAHKKDVEVSRVKSDFISTAAHQLRTPLTGIRWALEALEKSDLSEEHQALVKSAADKSHELVAIVGTLLDISAIESGKYKYTFTTVSLADLAMEVVTDFQPLAQKSSVSLYLEPRGVPIPPVRADRERIKWVLNNLIENAIRYTPAGGSVRVSLDTLDSIVRLSVRDTGIGIGSEDRNNIFQRFYRAQNAIAIQNGGNGLGLYIARTIATDHSGDISFASNAQGPGTTFTLTLPIAQG